LVERVLISTLSAQWGGVITMLEFITSSLIANGFQPVLAYYEPYRQSPHMSVPSFRLGTRRPAHFQTTAMGDVEAHAIGAWLPELEFTHYQATQHWRKLMDGCTRFLGVSGNVLVATPFLQTNRKYSSWVATGWEDDRRDRIKSFGVLRRLLDKSINAPRLRELERQLLKSGKVLALSEHTRHVLNDISGTESCKSILPIPIDYETFRPDSQKLIPRRIGFSGRLDDPRKNLQLLLSAVVHLRKKMENFELILIGGTLPFEADRFLQQNSIARNVRTRPGLSKTELALELQQLDVFVVPSHQEGLCISALEAMACGCPVISTKCGGPEEFVLDDQTGYLVGFNPKEMADAIERILSSRSLRQRLSENARHLVVEHYNLERCTQIFWQAFDEESPLFSSSNPPTTILGQ